MNSLQGTWWRMGCGSFRGSDGSTCECLASGRNTRPAAAAGLQYAAHRAKTCFTLQGKCTKLEKLLLKKMNEAVEDAWEDGPV